MLWPDEDASERKILTILVAGSLVLGVGIATFVVLILP